jgi:hypothetical protein
LSDETSAPLADGSGDLISYGTLLVLHSFRIGGSWTTLPENSKVGGPESDCHANVLEVDHGPIDINETALDAQLDERPHRQTHRRDNLRHLRAEKVSARGRLADPDEIAAVAGFLLSPDA